MDAICYGDYHIKQSALLIAVCILIQIISLASFGLNVYANSANISLEFYNGDFGASVLPFL